MSLKFRQNASTATRASFGLGRSDFDVLALEYRRGVAERRRHPRVGLDRVAVVVHGQSLRNEQGPGSVEGGYLKVPLGGS